MKKLLLFALLATFLLSFTEGNDLPIGADMPKGDIKMKEVGGGEITLRDATKKNGLLVMFSCNTCPYVVKNQQRTRAVCQYALDQGLGVVLVNANEAQRGDDDSYEAMKAYAQEQGYTWYYVVDKNSVLADAFGASRTPENFLFNKEGKLVYHGAIDDSPADTGQVHRQHLREAIAELAAGKEISIKTSRSVGCGIKRKG